VPPSLVVDQNVACLNGPGEIYGVRAYLAANTVPPLAVAQLSGTGFSSRQLISRRLLFRPTCHCGRQLLRC
jgi:hypothetical protein